MSLFERGPRPDGQSDPSTRQALRRLQDDPVRLAALLAGANSVVPQRRRRGAGVFTATTVMVLLLLSAVEAPDLFAAVGWTSPHTFSARNSGSGHGMGVQPRQGYSNGAWYAPSASPSKAPSRTSHTPPPTMAEDISPANPLARASVSSSASPSQSQTTTPSADPTPTPSETPSPSDAVTTSPTATATQSSAAPSPTPSTSTSATPTPDPSPSGHGKKPHGGSTVNK